MRWWNPRKVCDDDDICKLYTNLRVHIRQGGTTDIGAFADQGSSAARAVEGYGRFATPANVVSLLRSKCTRLIQLMRGRVVNTVSFVV